MLTRVEVRTSRGTLLSLPMADVSDGIVIDEIEGLGPVKATLVSSSFANEDGAQFHSSRREPRNIKFKFSLEPDYINMSVEDVRDRLYSFFMPESTIQLRFFKHTGFFADIEGVVESADPEIFTDEPEMNISVMCYKPDFVVPAATPITGLTTSGVELRSVQYDGTVDTGIAFELRPDRPVSAFTIYHNPPDGTLRQMDFSLPMVAGDKLSVSTVRGAKSVMHKRAGVERSVLYALSPQSPWLELVHGENKLRVYAAGVGIPWTINRIDKYGGL